MEIFLPTLEAKMTALVVAFRFIVFSIMVVGLVAHVCNERGQGTGLLFLLVKALAIVTLIAYLDLWFPKVDQTFLAVADYVNPGYNNNPTGVSDTVRESTTENPEGQSWSWRRLNESFYQAITNALSAIFIFLGTLLTVPMLITQYVLKWLLYLLAPFALAMFMVPGLSSLGVRFLQQVLAVHAWPVGFAITNMVALAVWNDFRNAVGANPAMVGDALYSPLLTHMGGLLAVIIIVVGMGSTPIVMQKLFVQGMAFSGSAGNPVSVYRATSAFVRGASAMKSSGSLATRSASSVSNHSPAGQPPVLPGARPGI